MTTATTPQVHEYVPFPLTDQDHVGKPCNGGCYCAALACGERKGDRTVHYQARDRRRPKTVAA